MEYNVTLNSVLLTSVFIFSVVQTATIYDPLCLCECSELRSFKMLLVSEQDCAVCLQKCQHPTQLPCGHIFCFLCVKGVAFQGRKCAMCRSAIPIDYLDNPVLLDDLYSQQLNPDNNQDVYQWYYEGRNGWWKYDERSNAELESAHSMGMPDCTLLLAGALYIVDFQAMTQIRQNDHTRRRHVKRDTPLFPAKGVAGIKTEKRHLSNSKDEENSDRNNRTENSNIESSVNEQDQPTNSQSDNIDNVVNMLRIINIDDSDPTGDLLEDT